MVRYSSKAASKGWSIALAVYFVSFQADGSGGIIWINGDIMGYSKYELFFLVARNMEKDQELYFSMLMCVCHVS